MLCIQKAVHDSVKFFSNVILVFQYVENKIRFEKARSFVVKYCSCFSHFSSVLDLNKGYL